ncbi:nucleotidyltransferase family protein [Methanoculleus palmolei]|uniref:Nucleotidyltransferase family protein n=1 Tax=Methanoculleus palmolei TaxID=72612 RepID=A0ABD8AAX0_9EURY|nr:nucleotidyltransferase family protein [Methanoculleus palmolei]
MWRSSTKWDPLNSFDNVETISSDGNSAAKRIIRVRFGWLYPGPYSAINSTFGSYARESADATSDIDILVRFSRVKSLFSIVRIEDELARALSMKVNLVTENAVSLYLADAIYRDAVVIYDAGGLRISPPHP